MYTKVKEERIIPLYETWNLSVATGLTSTMVFEIQRDYTFLSKKFNYVVVKKKKKQKKT